jgi:hypothetical protein
MAWGFGGGGAGVWKLWRLWRVRILLDDGLGNGVGGQGPTGWELWEFLASRSGVVVGFGFSLWRSLVGWFCRIRDGWCVSRCVCICLS